MNRKDYEMKKKLKISATLVAILLVSIAFVPAASAQTYPNDQSGFRSRK